MHPLRVLLFALGSLGLACAPAKDPLTPSPAERSALNAQFDRVFAGITPLDAASWDADRNAVRALHLFCYWVESYHALTQRYPLADRVQDGSWVQSFVYGNDSQVDYTNPANILGAELLADMRAVLGPALRFPIDANESDGFGLYYTTSGSGFLASVDLRHPVNGCEMVEAERGQYRLASYASEAGPIHAFAGVLSGAGGALPEAAWRDPALPAAR